MSGSKIATVGAVLLMFNHGIITIGFFLIIGFIEQRRGSIPDRRPPGSPGSQRRC
jgi:NADH:ubiquinone oxidoreductase subunit 4 (subunit M)